MFAAIFFIFTNSGDLLANNMDVYFMNGVEFLSVLIVKVGFRVWTLEIVQNIRYCCVAVRMCWYWVRVRTCSLYCNPHVAHNFPRYMCEF